MGQKVEGGAQMMHRAGLLNGVGLQKLSCSSPNGPPRHLPLSSADRHGRLVDYHHRPSRGGYKVTAVRCKELGVELKYLL